METDEEKPGKGALAFIDDLCGAFPAARRALLLQGDAPVSPDLLMAEVGRHLDGLQATADLHGSQPDGEAVRLCAFLSGAHAGGDDEVKQLACAAFVLSLEAPSESYAGLRKLLSPGLRTAVESAWPGVDFGDASTLPSRAHRY